MMSRRERNYKSKKNIVTFGQFVLPLAVIMALALMFFSVKLFFFNPTPVHNALPVSESESASHETVTKENNNSKHSEAKPVDQENPADTAKHVSIKSAVPAAAEKQAPEKNATGSGAAKTLAESADRNKRTDTAVKAVPAVNNISVAKIDRHANKMSKGGQSPLKKRSPAQLKVKTADAQKNGVKKMKSKESEVKKTEGKSKNTNKVLQSESKLKSDKNKAIVSADMKTKSNLTKANKKDKQSVPEKKSIKLPAAKTKAEKNSSALKTISAKSPKTTVVDKSVKKTSTAVMKNKDKPKTADGKGINRQEQQNVKTNQLSAENWDVQIGGFSDKKNSTQLLQKAHAEGYQAYISESEKDGAPFYRIRVRGAKDRTAAQKISSELQGRGYPVFLVKTQNKGSK